MTLILQLHVPVKVPREHVSYYISLEMLMLKYAGIFIVAYRAARKFQAHVAFLRTKSTVNKMLPWMLQTVTKYNL